METTQMSEQLAGLYRDFFASVRSNDANATRRTFQALTRSGRPIREILDEAMQVIDATEQHLETLLLGPEGNASSKITNEAVRPEYIEASSQNRHFDSVKMVNHDSSTDGASAELVNTEGLPKRSAAGISVMPVIESQQSHREHLINGDHIDDCALGRRKRSLRLVRRSQFMWLTFIIGATTIALVGSFGNLPLRPNAEEKASTPEIIQLPPNDHSTETTLSHPSSSSSTQSLNLFSINSVTMPSALNKNESDGTADFSTPADPIKPTTYIPQATSVGTQKSSEAPQRGGLPRPVATTIESSAPEPSASLRGSTELPPEADVSGLLTRGDSLLAVGDVASARRYYERAADAGNGAAALRLGESYDADFLEQARLRGVRGDLSAAAFWYQRARQLGVSDAEILLNRIQTKSEKR